ncbi:unnamed protein product [Adineta ricciae]|uniref:Uncharacterized protein n=1 Tax=Adineta ricciae TaxID=249248 RepID=A0A815KN11_ADIRI|nr:unnamed protein product [Adineta ricciae]CAF1395277.1 unnamed protein product [Adineta ricciae]
MMSTKSKGPVIQVDRLIIDPRNPIQPKSVRSDVSPSSTIKDFLKNNSSEESYFFFPSNRIQIVRLTLDDLNKRESILSPIYESIEEQRKLSK